MYSRATHTCFWNLPSIFIPSALLYLRDRTETTQTPNSYMFKTLVVIVSYEHEHILVREISFLSTWWLQFACLRVIWLKIIANKAVEILFVMKSENFCDFLFIYLDTTYKYTNVYFVFDENNRMERSIRAKPHDNIAM